MKPKNDSMSNIETTSLLAVSSELFSLINIITLPDEANYSYQEFLNVLIHAATSSTNSLESASNDLRSKIPNIRIPSAAVLHQLDQKIIYPHYDFKHLTEKYFEIGMKLNDFSIQLVKY